jgi:hypothetical protein
MRNWTLGRGRPLPKRKKRQRWRKKSWIRGNTGPFKSYGPHCSERERERKRKKNLWMMVITSNGWHLIRELLGMNNLREESSGCSWRMSTAGKRVTGRKLRYHKQKRQIE